MAGSHLLKCNNPSKVRISGIMLGRTTWTENIFQPEQYASGWHCSMKRMLWSKCCFHSSLLPPHRIKPSSGCGPFRNLPFMFHSGKQWAQELKSTNPKLAWLNWVHSCLVENPLFLFLMGGVFLWVSIQQGHSLDCSGYFLLCAVWLTLLCKAILTVCFKYVTFTYLAVHFSSLFFQNGHLHSHPNFRRPKETNQSATGANRKCVCVCV